MVKRLKLARQRSYRIKLFMEQLYKLLLAFTSLVMEIIHYSKYLKTKATSLHCIICMLINLPVITIVGYIFNLIKI